MRLLLVGVDILRPAEPAARLGRLLLRPLVHGGATDATREDADTVRASRCLVDAIQLKTCEVCERRRAHISSRHPHAIYSGNMARPLPRGVFLAPSPASTEPLPPPHLALPCRDGRSLDATSTLLPSDPVASSRASTCWDTPRPPHVADAGRRLPSAPTLVSPRSRSTQSRSVRVKTIARRAFEHSARTPSAARRARRDLRRRRGGAARTATRRLAGGRARASPSGTDGRRARAPRWGKWRAWPSSRVGGTALQSEGVHRNNDFHARVVVVW